VLEESEEETQMALEPVPEVVLEEVPVEGEMIAACGGSFPIPWCTSTVFAGALHSCYRGCCVRRRTGGGPGASHPLCVR
jgi:hypothetical protein